MEREIEIVKSLMPEAPNKLVESVVNAVQRIRNMALNKKPSIRATVDWVKTLMALGNEELSEETFKETVSVVLKNQDDKKKVERHFFK